MSYLLARIQVSVAGCLGYDVLVYSMFGQLEKHQFQLLVV
jgi:hypothetical protein